MQQQILCEFEDRDLAELAAWRLRNRCRGVEQIQIKYPAPGRDEGEPALQWQGRAFPYAVPFAAMLPLCPLEYSPDQDRTYEPGQTHAARMLIRCQSAHAGEIMGKLVNAGAVRSRFLPASAGPDPAPLEN